MLKIRKRKLNHLFTNIPSTIPQIFQSSRRVNIQLGNKVVNKAVNKAVNKVVNKAVNKAGFLRREITLLTSEITIHTEYDRTYRLFRIQSVHNSTN